MTAIAGSSNAVDLFEDGKARDVPLYTVLQADDTVGGYTIYPGEGKWQFEKAVTGNATGAGNIAMGTLIAKQDESGLPFARLFVTTNLTQGDSRFWTGSPCAPGHLVTRNKGRGREDNCMTIDPVNFDMGGRVITVFSIKLTISGSGGRYYASTLQLNPALLGVRDSGYGDWTADVVETQPYKRDFINRLSAWAEKLQDATTAAFAFDKPKDAFKDLPSWRTLLNVPGELTQKKLSWTFLSAVEDLKHNKSGFKAIAYSQMGNTQWGSAWKQSSQELANKTALANCEKNRWADAPECQLLPIDAP